ncbi:MAG: hypothetical protein HRT74_11340 [Flavobacteriales bacterium]|nr:hypothetical protein [Flavobacteriales bacterium]
MRKSEVILKDKIVSVEEVRDNDEIGHPYLISFDKSQPRKHVTVYFKNGIDSLKELLFEHRLNKEVNSGVEVIRG